MSPSGLESIFKHDWVAIVTFITPHQPTTDNRQQTTPTDSPDFTDSADSADYTAFPDFTTSTANSSTSRFSVEKLMPRAMSFLPEARYLSR